MFFDLIIFIKVMVVDYFFLEFDVEDDEYLIFLINFYDDEFVDYNF